MTSDAYDQALTGHGDRWLGPLCGRWPDAHDADWADELAEAGARLAAVLDQPGGAPYGAVVEELDAAATEARSLPTANPAAADRLTVGILVRLDRAERLAENNRREFLTQAEPLAEPAVLREAESAGRREQR